MPERIQPRIESHELIGESGRLPVASARHLAGVEGVHFTRSGSELAQHREIHAKHLREVTTLDHSHVRDVSTQERLQKSAVANPDEIAQRNQEWGKQLKTWLESVPEALQAKVGELYHLNRADEKILDKIEQFRSYYFDYDRPAGEVNERAVIENLVYRHKNPDDITLRNALSVGEVAENLKVIQPFLYLFGGEATAAHITHAALAEAALANAPEVGTPEREKFVEEMLSLVEKDMPEGDVKHYSTIPSDTVVAMAIPPAGKLVEPLIPAPIDERVAKAEQGGNEAESDGNPTRSEGNPVAEARRAGAGDGSSPEQPTKVLDYGEFQRLVMERELAEFPDLQAWVHERIAALPEMNVEKGKDPMTNGRDWNAEIEKADGKEVLKSVTNTNHFFTLTGVTITKGDRKWTQPGLLEDTMRVTIQTEFGPVELDTSAFIGVVSDGEGHTLVAIDQEPLANTPNHAVVKDPLQTSAGKFLAVLGDPASGMEGDPSKDPAFFNTLQLVFGEEDTRGKFEMQLREPGAVWPMGPVNGNRLYSPNISFEIVITDPDQREKVLAGGRNRWVSQDEIRALQRSGLLNLIGNGAFTAA